MTSIISAVSWVPKGVASRHPARYAADEAELERIEKLTQSKLDAAREDAMDEDWEDEEDSEDGMDKEQGSDVDQDMDNDSSDGAPGDASGDAMEAKVPSDPNDLSAYNLDDYDIEKPEKNKALSHIDIEEDPFVSQEAQAEELAEEEAELEISPRDNLIVAARTEDELSQLEVYVYEETGDNLYAHHDLLLPAMPLCLEWLDFAPGRGLEKQPRSNYIAVGTMDPEIEIWSLDVVDGLYPDAILGGTDKKKSSKHKKNKVNTDAHTDAVLGLSWNTRQRNLLASASADTTVKLWDLSLESHAPALRSYSMPDKVQSVKWNAHEPSVLLVGAFGGHVSVFDSRSPDQSLTLSLDADVECLEWDPYSPSAFTLGLDNGIVQHYDSRSPGAPLWTLAAHDGSVSALGMNTSLRGLLATGGDDERVKLWHIDESGDRKISLVDSRDPGVGKVFSASFAPDELSSLAIAGSNGVLQVWDVAASAGVKKTWHDQVAAAGKSGLKGGVVVVDNDDEDED